MITIDIAINFDTIHTVSAINTGSKDNIVFEYDVFIGLVRGHAKEVKKINHVRTDGASALVIKMLEAFPTPKL